VYAIRVKKRDALCRELKNKGIGSIIYYPVPLHLQEAYKDLGYKKGDFPVSEKISLEIMSLPLYPYLNETQIRYVVSALKNALAY
jgi:UDP-2-acetamido-2-deoxy-ribo-hexuluronate aminotransferase